MDPGRPKTTHRPRSRLRRMFSWRCWLWTVAGLVLLGAMSVALGAGIWRAVENWRYDRSGRVVQGRALQRRAEKHHTIDHYGHGNGTTWTSWHVRYEFIAADGGRHEAEREVEPRIFRSAEAGAPLTVEYLAGSPSHSRPVDPQRPRGAGLVLWPLAGLLLPLGLLAISWRRAGREG